MPTSTSFLNSSLFSTITTSVVTFLVGSIALVIYRRQQADKKRDAATIILLEIKNAEEHLVTAKESILKYDLIKDDLFVLPSSQWEKYSYLFVRDFSSREWADITAFYEKCKLYDKIVEYNNSFFVKNEEQIRSNLHKALADYTQSYLAELQGATDQDQADELKKLYKKLVVDFANTFMEEETAEAKLYFYSPVKTLTDAKVVINTIRTDLSTSTVGAKLEKISK